MADESSSVALSQLPNGIRVVTERMPGVPSVTVGIWVENGSRFERPEQAGISHYLEHLFFKGTERRTAAQIAEEFDAVGGVFNAFTGKEYTCYYGKVLAEHSGIAEDILSDIFLNSRFDPEEIERERSVIIQEIMQGEDTPDDYVHDLFNLHYWPKHPLSLPICGNVETVSSFGQAQFLDFIDKHYRPNRIVVAAAGDLDHQHIVDWASQHFGALSGTTEVIESGAPSSTRGVNCTSKPLEQMHVCMGLPGISQTSEDRYAAYLLNTALGGGMSSRLFQEVREKRGKAYSVYSFLSSYRDAGYLGFYVGTSPEWVEEVVQIILVEIEKMKQDGLSPDELKRVKSQLKGNMLLGLETSDSRMSRIAKNQIYLGGDVSPAEVSLRIDAVTNQEILDLGARLLSTEALGLTMLGDLKDRTYDEEIFNLH